jgi:hypothetical protein
MVFLLSKFLKKRFLLTGPKISVTNTPTVTTQKFRSRTILFGHLRVFPKKLCVSVCFQKKMTQTSCPDQRTRLKTRPCGDVGGSGYDPIFYYSSHHIYSDYPFIVVPDFVFRTTKTHVIVHLYPKLPHLIVSWA